MSKPAKKSVAPAPELPFETKGKRASVDLTRLALMRGQKVFTSTLEIFNNDPYYAKASEHVLEASKLAKANKALTAAQQFVWNTYGKYVSVGDDLPIRAFADDLEEFDRDEKRRAEFKKLLPA